MTKVGQLVFLLSFLLLCCGIGVAQVGQIPDWPPKGGGSGCAASNTAQARMDGGQNIAAVATAICGIVSDGNLSGIDGLYVGSTNSVGNSLINWAQNAFDLISNGTISFAANAGWTGSSNGYYNTQFNPSTAGGQYALNSAMLGTCVLNARTAGAAVNSMGANDGTNESILNPRQSTNLAFAVNSTTAVNIGNTNSQGAWYITRSSSSPVGRYLNGSSLSTVPSTSSGLPNANIYLLAGNYSGGAGGFNTTDQHAYFLFGKAIANGTVASAIYNRLHTYLQTVGETTAC